MMLTLAIGPLVIGAWVGRYCHRHLNGARRPLQPTPRCLLLSCELQLYGRRGQWFARQSGLHALESRDFVMILALPMKPGEDALCVAKAPR